MTDNTITNHPPTRLALDADDNMRQAIERFRTRMAAANRQVIQQRVDEIEARGLATEKEKLDRMRDYRYFEDLGTGGEAEWGTAETRSKANRLRQTTWLADAPTLEDALLVELDGQVFQRQADDWAAEAGEEAPGPIPPCHELGLFLKDLEGLDRSQERNKIQELMSQDRTRLRERLKQDNLGLYLINRALTDGLVDDDLEVRAGFVTGTGYCGEYPEWYSAYLYCRQCVDDEDNEDDDEEDKDKSENTKDALTFQDWAWRVIFLEASIQNTRVPYGRRASWLDHLDARGLLRLQRHRAGCETDCESDCELH
ncbi:hypothetical protein BDV24DRAFT_171081 [Aspergillus arachidicola]|uniref:Uncharacterized protein n=1 Tax=Aspergillus arachidicola TaxID=656916 RepID=A0A5N6YJN7_9EURO|nr:hypothetical protein BDV24DRAFT_171081 [Aspergillus arachidicola]